MSSYLFYNQKKSASLEFFFITTLGGKHRIEEKHYEHPHRKMLSYSTLPFQKTTLSIIQYHFTILQHPNFYFTIKHVKIIFLYNKIIYPKITIIYNTTHYLFFLSHSFCSRTTTNLLNHHHHKPTTAALHTLDTTTTTTNP